MDKENNGKDGIIYFADISEVTTLRQGEVDLSGRVEGGFSGNQKGPVRIIFDETSDDKARQEFEKSARSLGIVIN